MDLGLGLGGLQGFVGFDLVDGRRWRGGVLMCWRVGASD